MIRVEDVTLQDFERKRIFNISGTESELLAVEDALNSIDETKLSKRNRDVFHSFRHTFTSAIQW